MIEKKYNDIATEVINLFREVGDISNDTNHISTTTIFQKFSKLAESHEYWYCPAPEYGNSEWLYDFVWFNNCFISFSVWLKYNSEPSIPINCLLS